MFRQRGEGLHIGAVSVLAANNQLAARPDGSKAYFEHSVLPFGACAERTLVAANEVWDFPSSAPDEQAALGISATGALVALEKVAIKLGENILVLGATGVLGQAALRLFPLSKCVKACEALQSGAHVKVLLQPPA